MSNVSGKNQNFYYGGSNAFPQPLTADNEEKYLLLYKNGDQNAKDILIEHNLRLVAHIVKKYSTTYSDTEDLISIGTIGLIKGITTFNPEKATRLATYVARCIENEILMFLRSAKKYNNDLSLQDPISRDKEGNEITILDIISQTADTVTNEVDLNFDISALHEFINSQLKPRERLVIELRYGLTGNEEKTQREIATMLGISRSYVSRIETRAIKKLGDKMCAEENKSYGLCLKKSK
ncbi:MAG: RNA polymerase sporulation sigma factor SigK [Anaerotignaceae bacterium]